MPKYTAAQGAGPAVTPVPASSAGDRSMVEQLPGGQAVYTSLDGGGYLPAYSTDPLPAGRGRA